MKQHNDARKIEKQLDYQAGQEADQPAPASREAWEKEQYACFYNVLFPPLKEGRLLYEKIAKRTNLKEHRIQEVLTFRLKSSNRSAQLFGHREGSCYVCSNRQNSPTNREPVCLKCLQAIESAYLEIEQDLLLLENSIAVEEPEPFELPLLLHDFTEADIPEKRPPVNDPEKTVPVSEVEQLKAELQRYKSHFGELPPTENPEKNSKEEPESITPNIASPSVDKTVSDSPDTIPTIEAPSPPKESVPDQNDSDQLLQLLELDDREVACELQDVNDFVNTFQTGNGTPLRHFGFQRSKSVHKA